MNSISLQDMLGMHKNEVKLKYGLKMQEKYKDLDIEEFKKVFDDYLKENPKLLDDISVKEIAPGVYRLPGGAITGDGGLKLFEEVMVKAAKENVKNYGAK